MRHLVNESLSYLELATWNHLGWGLTRLRGPSREQRLAGFLSRNHQHRFPVVFAHGVLHNRTAFFKLENRLKERGFSDLRPLDFWTTLHSLESMATQLKNEVREAWRAHVVGPHCDENAFGVRIVAHSLGGIIARIALLDPAFAPLVDRVIFLGTPHQGVARSLPAPLSLREIARESPLMARLREEPLPGGIRYYNLRGARDLVIPPHAAFLPGVPNLTLELGHAGLLSDERALEQVTQWLESAAGPSPA